MHHGSCFIDSIIRIVMVQTEFKTDVLCENIYIFKRDKKKDTVDRGSYISSLGPQQAGQVAHSASPATAPFFQLSSLSYMATNSRPMTWSWPFCCE